MLERGWDAFGGGWAVRDGVLQAAPSAGSKLVRAAPEVGDGTVECDVRIADNNSDIAGLIVRVSDAHNGADDWNGYEVSLDVKTRTVLLGRHRHDWHPLQAVPAAVEAGMWHHLRVEMSGARLRIFLDAGVQPVIDFTDTDRPLLTGRVGLRTWNSEVSFRDLKLTGATTIVDRLNNVPAQAAQVSGMWDGFYDGTVVAGYGIDEVNPYNSLRSQRLEHGSGSGVVGIANRGLNRWGIAVRSGHTYAGHLYLRQQGYRGRVTVALQSADGARTYARQALAAPGATWSRRDFTWRSTATDANARFALWIDRPGTVWVDQVYLSGTGDELFHGLPYRADIANMMVAEGLKFLRYAGTMVNVPGYRWKQMIGDPDRRPQYRGNWYTYSTNGFGIEEFLRFCEAAHIEAAFAINIEETPQDAADLVEYLNGPVTTVWGARRAANGHPRPYNVHTIEIGNEEDTGAHYLERFKLLEPAMHAKDPALRLVIAAWWDPNKPATKQIVQELNGKAALWDVHVGGDDLNEGANVDRLFTQMQQLVQEWSPGNPLKAVVFEENGGQHNLRRALGHARIINATRRHGDFVLVDCPANCLQPWRQNDNGWDQGQIFFIPDHAWAMPPFYVQQMASRNHEPLCVESAVDGAPGLDVLATRSEDGKTLVLSVVNTSAAPVTTTLSLADFNRSNAPAQVWTLTGGLDDVNPPDGPETVRSQQSPVALGDTYTFGPYSYTMLRLGQ